MAKNIVMCADGTGNSFGGQISNVSRLVQMLELGASSAQVVIYDQGIGTDPSFVNVVEGYQAECLERRALTILDPPRWRRWPLRPLAQLAGLTVGYGLRQNVKELYTALARTYQEPGVGSGDRIHLFGFSRGAFTVRVLAGLLYRCGLLRVETPDFDAKFHRAYELYRPHLEDYQAVRRFKEEEGVRSPRIHFLGLWDTVKSYGGIWPQSLPHLRHNPIVTTVRHALALDEQRSWFLPTSWGGIDSDRPMQDHERYLEQDVVEVWFQGSHSDVGGGYEKDAAANVTLRWMLKETAPDLLLNRDGEAFIAAADPTCLTTHESLTGHWIAVEYLPRWELDNRYRPPKRFFKCGRSGARNPAQFARKQIVRLHASVGRERDRHVKHVETKPSRIDKAMPRRSVEMSRYESSVSNALD